MTQVPVGMVVRVVIVLMRVLLGWWQLGRGIRFSSGVGRCAVATPRGCRRGTDAGHPIGGRGHWRASGGRTARLGSSSQRPRVGCSTLTRTVGRGQTVTVMWGRGALAA